MKIENTSNNHQKALTELEKIDPAVCRQAMSNFDKYINGLRKSFLLQTLSSHLSNAEANYRNRDLYGEEKELEIIWNVLRAGRFSDSDLKKNNLVDYSTGTFLTIQKLRKRLKYYGWKERKPELIT
ncbi:hypothetical protein [Rhodohalobacter sp. 8-1]|uniref:hypothetical protein n=1 Tax=Rhodohalobacter sp. 8-1 TaxID=3131972 RepID=UPI0030ECCA76